MDALPRRTLVLTERVPHVCRLRRHDADFLLHTQRGRLDVLPTHRRHTYRLTSLGYVGVLVAPTCRIVVQPKIPLHNVFHLLDPDADLRADVDAVAPMPGAEIVQFLAGQFLARLRERLATGLQRGYAEHEHRGPLLQGRPRRGRPDARRRYTQGATALADRRIYREHCLQPECARDGGAVAIVAVGRGSPARRAARDVAGPGGRAVCCRDRDADRRRGRRPVGAGVPAAPRLVPLAARRLGIERRGRSTARTGVSAGDGASFRAAM